MGRSAYCVTREAETDVVLGDLRRFVNHHHVEGGEILWKGADGCAEHSAAHVILFGTNKLFQSRVDAARVATAPKRPESALCQQQADAVHSNVGVATEENPEPRVTKPTVCCDRLAQGGIFYQS